MKICDFINSRKWVAGDLDGSKDILSSMWQNFNKKLWFGDRFSCDNGLGEDKGDWQRGERDNLSFV